MYLEHVRLFPILLIAACRLAGGTDPRPEPGQYPAHATAAGAALGAEFLGRYLPGDKGSLMTGAYLVVELAFYPRSPRPVPLSSGDFRLRLNGKLDLVAQSPGIVAGSLRNPQWDGDRGVTVGGGVGPAVIVMGPNRRQPRFPGDPEVHPPVGGEKTSSADPNQEKDAGGTALRQAMPEGAFARPVAGMLYFAWRDPVRKLKSIALVYDGPAGKLILPLK